MKTGIIYGLAGDDGSIRYIGQTIRPRGDGGANGAPGAITRARMSAPQRNRAPFSEETRRRLSAAHTGRVRTPETLAKASESLKSSEKAKAARARISAAQIGRKRSPESRARMAAAQRRRYGRMTEDERKALTAKANTAWRARAA